VGPGAFFHEPRQFEVLATGVLPQLAWTRRRLRLWSAGCGAGEEAWSLAMIVEEADLPAGVEVEIVATDADPRAVATAAEAVYPDEQMRTVSAERRRRHFVRGVGPRRGLWRVTAPLRDRVELCALDLDRPWLDRPGPAAPRFDVVFCRAPLTQRDPRAAEPLIHRLAAMLAPGGALFLGGPAPPALPGLDACGPGVYRRCTR